ncbi:hypothetical protein STFR1_30555 [Bacillus vallismortis]
MVIRLSILSHGVVTGGPPNCDGVTFPLTNNAKCSDFTVTSLRITQRIL